MAPESRHSRCFPEPTSLSSSWSAASLRSSEQRNSATRSAGRLRRPKMDPRPGLDARLLVGADDVLIGPQRLALPAPAIQVEDEPGRAFEVRIAREDAASIRPGPKRVLAQPAPDRRDRDRLDDVAGDRDPGDLRHRQASQRRAEISRSGHARALISTTTPRGHLISSQAHSPILPTLHDGWSVGQRGRRREA